MRVPLGAASYDILIGENLLGELPDLVTAACPATTFAVVADSQVAPLYGEQIARQLSAKLFSFPAGEWNKTRDTWAHLTDQLLASGIGRDGAIIALGGGVAGDVAGFVAATYLRGIPYVQVPTTLLAMVDSSVGGKTGVDTEHGKNLIGAFYQPRIVVADVSTLGSLSKNQLKAGMAEALKHGVIADAPFFERLVAERDAVVACRHETLVEIVHRAVEIKAAVVAEDEREQGRRAVLNFGHTVAHAIETTTGFEFLHGEAVAIGMVTEAALGMHTGITSGDAARTLQAALERFDLPVELPDVPVAQLVEAMRHDKKNRRAMIRFAMLRTLGEMAQNETGEWTFPLKESTVASVLQVQT